MKNKIINKSTFIGFIDMKTNKYWSRSVLGKTIDVCIKNIPMKIHFPGLPKEWENEENKDYLHYCLSSPKISENYRYSNEKIFYGLPCNYPSSSSFVKIIVLSFEMEESKLNFIKKDLYKNIEDAITKLHKLLYIINKSLKPMDQVKQMQFGIDLYNKSFGKKIKNEEEVLLVGHIYEDSNSITYAQVKKIMEIISKDLDIPVEYDFFISGIQSYEHHDNRQCILDLSTACEISVTAKIEELQKNQKIGNFLNDYKMLSQKYKLLNLLGFDTSFADINVITGARNKAIHKGEKVTNDEAIEAIKVARNILNKLSKFY